MSRGPQWPVKQGAAGARPPTKGRGAPAARGHAQRVKMPPAKRRRAQPAPVSPVPDSEGFDDEQLTQPVYVDCITGTISRPRAYLSRPARTKAVRSPEPAEVDLTSFEALLFSQAEHCVHLAACRTLTRILEDRSLFFKLLRADGGVRRSTDRLGAWDDDEDDDADEGSTENAGMPSAHEDAFQALYNIVMASCVLGHRSCVALWGPRGSGKHRLLRFLMRDISDPPCGERESNDSRGPAVTKCTTGPARNKRPRGDVTPPVAPTAANAFVLHLDGFTLGGDEDALRSIAEQLRDFLFAPLRSVAGGRTGGKGGAGRGGSVDAARTLMEKDWSFRMGEFTFGALFGFPAELRKVREGGAPGRDVDLGNVDANRSESSDGASASDEATSDELETDDTPPAASLLLTRTTAGPGGGVASALPALQEAFLTMRSHGISLVICISNAERFGFWCDQVLYVLSGMLHESDGRVSGVGGMSLVLTSSAPDLQHLEKRLSSRLTCEMRFIPMVRFSMSHLIRLCYQVARRDLLAERRGALEDHRGSVLRRSATTCWRELQISILEFVIRYAFRATSPPSTASSGAETREDHTSSFLEAIRAVTAALDASGASNGHYVSAATDILCRVTSGLLPVLRHSDRFVLADKLAATLHATLDSVAGVVNDRRESRRSETAVGTTGGGDPSARWAPLWPKFIHRLPQSLNPYAPAFFQPADGTAAGGHDPSVARLAHNGGGAARERTGHCAALLSEVMARGAELPTTETGVPVSRPVPAVRVAELLFSPLTRLPDVLDLLSDGKLIRLGYCAREGFLLHLYATVHADAGVPLRRVGDLLEDVASSLGTRAAASLDREAFRHALSVLLRLRVLYVTTSTRNGPPSAAVNTGRSEETGSVGLVGMLSRHKAYLLEVLESTELSETGVGLDARERLYLRNLL